MAAAHVFEMSAAPLSVRLQGGGERLHRSLIRGGISESLRHVPFHANGVAPLHRRVLAGTNVHPAIKKHVVAHEIREVSSQNRSYCEPHVHDCDEMNILLSLTGLTYEIRLGDEVYVVEAPATIHIPAGLVHSANVIEGSGFYIALLETQNYLGSVGPAGAGR
jgi:hypothetical protein